MTKRYVVTLTDEERRSLCGLISSGKASARKPARARILLKADSGAGGLRMGRRNNDSLVKTPLDLGVVARNVLGF